MMTIRRLPEVPLRGGEHPNTKAEVGDAVGQDARLEAPRAVPEQVVRDPRHQHQPLRVFGREETRRDQERDPRERPRRDRLEVGPDQPPDQESAPEELLRDRDDEDSSDKAQSDPDDRVRSGEVLVGVEDRRLAQAAGKGLPAESTTLGRSDR
jgi:hypothetical protein